MIHPLSAGKLPTDLLRVLLGRIRLEDPRVLVGPKIGEDAAVIDMGRGLLVITCDPITFATDELGWYGVMVNANDLAVRGAEPRWYVMAVLLPEGTATFAMADTIIARTEEACREVGATLVGGHTEISVGLTRPIVVGTMVGEVERERLVTSSGARRGDRILLTKGIAIEGTALLGREMEAELRRKGVAPGQIQAAKRLLRVPGIGVLKEARVAVGSGHPTAMHDPTEGGLSAGLYELAEASGVGIRLDLSAVPILPESRVLCGALGLDPLGLIASGALLLTVAPAETGTILASMEREGIACQIIGEVVSPEEGISIVEDGRRRPLPRFERDELARLFGTTFDEADDRG